MANEGDPITLKPVEGIARVELWTDVSRKPQDWELRCYFEGYLADEDGKPYGAATFGQSKVGSPAQFSRAFGAIASDTETINGKTVSIAELAAFVKAFCYRYLADEREKPKQEVI